MVVPVNAPGHVNTYGEVPPTALAVAAPVLPPKQFTLVDEGIEAVTPVGSTMVTVSLDTQPPVLVI